MFPSQPPPLAGVVHTDVRVRSVRWHVATAGEGPPVVLLHGWPQHWWAWRKVIPDLAKDHRVYAPDLRGFGWSDAPEGRYDKANLAADVELLLDELAIERCLLVGHDWGGFAGFLTALRAPERIERLVALNIIHPWIDVPPPSPKALALVSYQFVLATPLLGELVQRNVPQLVQTLLQQGSGPGYHYSAEDLRLYSGAFRRPAHARAASALYRTFLTRELPAIARGRYANRTLEVPALLATSDSDRVVTPERIAGGTECAPQLRTAVIEGAGHFTPEEAPQRVIELIREA